MGVAHTWAGFDSWQECGERSRRLHVPSLYFPSRESICQQAVAELIWYTDGLVLQAKFGGPQQLMADLVRPEAVCIGVVINPDKTKSLAITIEQPPAPEYNL
ncbi:hypothetical protein KIL84_015836 [Mauremys mutica]|uniref:Uncharacterized protein n=1 Tax=Mauremys mutica TaxID=74926 RepID=A0A9D4AQ80_9SAUR|nr:hypothetical protein KIL84_015836 [Mauremys mutica]